MIASYRYRNMLLWCCLLSCLTLGQSFFLPSFSSSSSSNNIPKKSEVSTLQWPGVRDGVYYGQHYHSTSGFEHAVPVAVPYPVAVPAPMHHAQVALSAPPGPPASLSSSATLQGAYHNMQLVPCLCSVPKDDIEDSSSLVVQSSQQITN